MTDPQGASWSPYDRVLFHLWPQFDQVSQQKDLVEEQERFRADPLVPLGQRLEVGECH